MPAERTEKTKPSTSTRQLTLTGKPVPNGATTTKKSKSKSKKDSPDRVYTDTVLCIKPEFVQMIAKKEKNHEYRKYQLRDGVVRLWLYETAPVGAIKYVMLTGRPKTPGEVNDPTGVGNDDFDNGLKQSKFGYPALGLYRLTQKLDTEEMKKYGISGLQGYCYATKKVVEAFPIEEMERVF
ncbi:hypothetical protein SISNIDRAFT_469951 [Sistotremastrum niveocremeum HHB9708]|uniref:ASCH domain-containing protein n=2 Tax=Sistotremastraceae TaxID=3402574 RepID=A0A164PFM0_9AGAM|nr:hypothetical protein SISNIDRAFT_469951 [Sistotremastrum niveocremeum HHB9708]KZT37286.1 hypothetical protein SISSUDRAFT_987973 [Sistotremastrum suecicum HHB10207 ss-3]